MSVAYRASRRHSLAVRSLLLRLAAAAPSILLMVFCAVLFAASRPAMAQGPEVVYDDQFENGWQSWSWATTNFSNTSPTYNSLADSISVTDNSGYEALWLHPSADFNDSGDYSISFWINGGPTGGQQLLVTGITDVNSVGTFVTLPTPIQANTWVFETIPLAALGVANVSNLAGFWLWNNTANPEPTYYVDEFQINGPPQIIYDNQLENGWADWSWAQTNDANPSPALPGATDSISVTNLSAYAALSLHMQPTVNSAGYQSITFWLNGGASGGQQLAVSGITELNNDPSSTTYSAVVPLPNPPVANTWVQETIPLSELGVSNDTDFAGFDVGNSPVYPQPTYYIGGVQLDADVSAGASANAQVTVNSAAIIGTIPPTPVGVNTAVWDWSLTDPPVNGLLASAGVRMLRYPGGSESDDYNWESNTAIGIPVDDSDSFNWAPDATFDSFIQNVAQPTGGVPIITCNYGSNENGTGGGDPALAAAWVQYANVTNSYGVKYWEIGNEVYGNGYYADANWETDLHVDEPNSDTADRVGNPLLSPTAYGQNVLTYVSAMKAVDPTIKVGAVLYAPLSSNSEQMDWNNKVLAACGSSVDFVILHWYPEYINDNDASLMMDPAQQIATMVSLTKQAITANCGANASNIQILVTETNSDAGTPGKQMMSTVQSLFMVDNIQTWLENGVYNVDYWDLHNGISFGDLDSSLFGSFTYGDEGMLSNASSYEGVSEPPAETPFASYYALQMDSYLGSPGDTMLQASSSQSDLIAHAVNQANGALAVMIENEDPITSYTTTLNLSGFNISSAQANGAQVYGPASSSIAWENIYYQTPSISGPVLTLDVPPYTIETVDIPEIAPTPTISPDGGRFLNPVQVTLGTAAPGTSIYYTTDGSNPATSSTAIKYNSAFTLSASATVQAVDMGASYIASSVASAFFAVGPLTPPSTAATVTGTSGNSPWYVSPVSVALTATSGTFPVATTYYELDNGSQTPYSAAIPIATDGVHKLVFWSVDNQGNQESHETQSISIDQTPPSLKFGKQTPKANVNGWNNTSVSIAYTTSDATSGVASAMPGSPVVFSSNGAGQTQTVTVTDVAGNIATFTTPAVNIDTIAPTTTAALAGTSGNLGWYRSAVKVTLSATDNVGGAGVAATYYSVDGGATTKYTAAFKFTPDGRHSVAFWSTDKAGNVEAQNVVAINIDATPPVSSASASGSAVPATITIAASDNLSGIAATYYSVNGGATTLYSWPFLIGTAGVKTVKYWSVDVAGNTEAKQTLTFTLSPVIESLVFTPAIVKGGAATKGKVTLNIAAPAGGAVVGLTSNSSAVPVPLSITVAAGATTATFTVDTTTVTSTTAAVVTASNSVSSVNGSVTVNAP